MNQSGKIIILIGPNGAGKSHICKILQKNNLCNYYSIEEIFMRKYHTLGNLSQNKEEAYHYFEDIIRTAPKVIPIIFEESGISEEANTMIHNLMKNYSVLLVEISADLTICLERVRSRGTKNNFFKDDQFVIRSKKKYLDTSAKKYHFTLSITNNNLSEKEILEIFRTKIV